MLLDCIGDDFGSTSFAVKESPGILGRQQRASAFPGAGCHIAYKFAVIGDSGAIGQLQIVLETHPGVATELCCMPHEVMFVFAEGAAHPWIAVVVACNELTKVPGFSKRSAVSAQHEQQQMPASWNYTCLSQHVVAGDFLWRVENVLDHRAGVMELGKEVCGFVIRSLVRDKFSQGN